MILLQNKVCHDGAALLEAWRQDQTVAELRRVAGNISRKVGLQSYPKTTQIRFLELWKRAENAVQMELCFDGSPRCPAKWGAKTDDEKALLAHYEYRLCRKREID